MPKNRSYCITRHKTTGDNLRVDWFRDGLYWHNSLSIEPYLLQNEIELVRELDLKFIANALELSKACSSTPDLPNFPDPGPTAAPDEEND